LRHYRESSGGAQSATSASVSPAQAEAFETFFRQYESRIAGYLWRMLGDEQAANDLSQETFLRAWEHFAEISTYPAPASWLFRVATNLALTYLRRRSAPVGAAMPLTDDLADIESISCDPIAQVDERDEVMQALLSLPAKQRALLVLRGVYGLTTEEAGRALGISLMAARKMLSRAHQQFRDSYQRVREGK
jgi:RNA polymerase sigma-70 factor (ECF subfamily)